MRREAFETLVAEAMDGLPAWLAPRLGNLEVVVEERPSRALCRELGVAYREGLLGLYQGASLLERDGAAMEGPSRVVLYRRMIETEAGGEGDLPRVVRETLAHEIGHHLGMGEAEIEAFEDAWARRPHSP